MGYPEEVLADNPHLYWRLGETSGTTFADETANNLDGTSYPYNLILGVPGAIPGNTAVTFEDPNLGIKSISKFSFPLTDNVFSLEAWIKKNSVAERLNMILTMPGSTMIVIERDGTISLPHTENPDGTWIGLAHSSTKITDTGWHHIVTTKSGATNKLYIDGVDVTVPDVNGDARAFNNLFYFFVGEGDVAADTMNLTIDEVALYPTALPLARIQAHYQAVFLPPVLTSPSGKLNAISGYSYSGIYSHPASIAANAIHIQVYNAAGTELLYDSGTIAKTIAHGASWSEPEWHGDLAWGTHYSWRAQVRDANNSWGPWSSLKAFHTNAPPYSPTNLTPGQNATVGLVTLRCSVSDPDGDTITAVEAELFDVTEDEAVAGYPANMVVSGNTAALTVTGDLVLNNTYQWRARASDGLNFGSFSGWETFSYWPAPVLDLVGPRAGGPSNLVEEPSAEYSPSGYWTEVNQTASDFIERISDGDAAFGAACWLGTASPTSENGYLGDFEAVDATKPYLAYVHLKRGALTDESATHFIVHCYDGSGVLLGDVYPSSLRGAEGVSVETRWLPYGGIIWPAGDASSPDFPVGTTQVRLEVIPSLEVESLVRFDAFYFDEVPLVSTLDWSYAQSWQGYFDGDTQGFDRSIGAPGYSWAGTPGNSKSTGISVLWQPGPYVVFAYSHPTGRPKTADRLIVRQKVGASYQQIYDSGWQGTTAVPEVRTAIPIPAGLLKNEGRYDLKVMARDNAPVTPVEGESFYIPFDVRYDGPAELPILVAEADPVRAETRLVFGQTALSPVAFGGVEIAVGDATGDPATAEKATVALITDPLTTEFFYSFPISGEPQGYYVRQVENRGPEQVQSRWIRVVVTADYGGRFFIKNAQDPRNLWLDFEPLRRALPSWEEVSAQEFLRTWGQQTPTELLGEAKEASGTLEVPFYDDATFSQSALMRFEILREIVERRGTVCLLLQLPARKEFVALEGGVSLGVDDLLKNSASLSWRRVDYEEGIYARG